MLPISRRVPHHSFRPRQGRIFAYCASGAVLALALAGPAWAEQPAPSVSTPNPKPRAQFDNDKLDFSANEVEYQDDADVVTAKGDVFLRRGDQTVHADNVRWNRKTGQIIATGHLRVVDAEGNELITEQMELSDDLALGLTHNMLMLMREGGRLAANEGRRDADGRFVLTKAAYTGCDVVDATGCPKQPSWRVTARNVVYDPQTKLVRFRGARLALFGASIIPLPVFKLATDGRALPGFLVPDFRLTSSNGVELSSTYYARLADNRDLDLTAFVFTKAKPMVRAHYRALTDNGAYQVTGYLTQSTATAVSGTNTQQQWRGYLEGNGKFQLDPSWSVDFSGRLASDRTFLKRYYINSDDTLRSNINVQRIGERSYFSVSGWAFQTLRTNEVQGLVPVALPLIDYRLRLDDPVLGGRVSLQANSLAISRSAGQDTQRAFTSAEWTRRLMTDLGQVVTLTGLVRGDVYHSTNNALTTTAIYRGLGGWQTRGVALAAVDVTWPLVGAALGGNQVLTPHIQVVAAPQVRNIALPNEDARAIELEDTNLFALNHFPGYDRVENGNRIAYGLEWQLERPRWRVDANVGQSYRLSHQPTLLPDGTGLSGRQSDVVGRTDIRYRDFFKITHRYRLDANNYVFRRNEIDATIGSDATYFEAGYARINRQISSTLEDLADSNELRAAGRIAFARYWSLFGSGIFDLSNSTSLTTTQVNSFQPLRTRLGMSFQSDCFQFDVTWRHDYVTVGDATRGSSFELRFALRNLGFR
jgi:LPS-assembly protein